MNAETDTPRRHGSNRRGRWFLIVLCGSAAAVLGHVAYQSIVHPPFQVTPLVGISFWLYVLTGVVFAARAWRHPGLDRRSRRAWGVLAVGYLLFFASAMLRPLYPIGVAFPSPADLLRLAFVPVMLAGLLMLPLRAQGRRERHKIWLDTTNVLIASVMVIWFVDAGPDGAAAQQVTAGAMAAAMAYPVSDLVLIFGAGIVLLRGGATSVRVPAILLGVGTLFLILGDVILGYELAQGAGDQTDQTSAWQWICWIGAHFLLAMAPVVQCRRATGHQLETDERRARVASKLPYLAIVVGYAVLLASVLAAPGRVFGLVLGAFAMTGVVVVRQVLALRENHELAITDGLTELYNRGHFYDLLRLALARSKRNHQMVAALLIDMNGFKQVNDTMGHDAGDQLLMAFGKILRRNVLGLDVVGRLGGDEFAVVLHNVGTVDNALTVARRIVADMDQPVLVGDTAVQTRASIGIALSAPGELTAEELLRRADQAMYQAKAATRATGTTSVATYPGDVTDSAAPVPAQRQI